MGKTNPDSISLRQADALLAQGRRRDAITVYRRALIKAPVADGWFNLAYALRQEGEYEEAIAAYANALRLGVHGAEEVHLNCAVIYSDYLRNDAAAEEQLHQALQLAPSYAPALLNLGNLYEEQGKREQALSCYERILASKEINTANGYEALARAAQLHTPLSMHDPLLLRVRAQAESTTAIDDSARANLFFVLGAALDKLGEYAQAFAAFESGKRFAHRAYPAYDNKKAALRTQTLMHAFSAREPQAVSGKEEAKQPSALFICGMFRSGSTLVEQVLGAHPAVAIGGELDILPRMALTTLAPFPHTVASLDATHYAKLAQQYLSSLPQVLREQAANKTWRTDKRPDNYLLIGLIMRLFPNAKIIHTTRHPVDNALSIFMQHLNPRVFDYAGSLASIGHQFVQYQQLMAHWKALYPDAIFDFNYDAFVAEPEQTLRPLLDFLGLEWNEGCLQFHRCNNTVKTASYWQVRRPLYREASGRWQHYQTFLSPLFAALDA